MKHIFTLALGLSLAASAFAQEAPAEGVYYRMVGGYTGTYAQNEQRPGACLGLRTLNDIEFIGVAAIADGDDSQLWQFVSKEIDGATVYAVSNRNGQYIPMLATDFSPATGWIGQDSRFAPVSYEGELPDEAFGFEMELRGVLDDTSLHANYAEAGAEVGDTWIALRPLKYRTGRNDDAVADNVAGTTIAGNPTPYYINMAGNGRQFALNLWKNEGNGPGNSQCFILVPEVREVPKAEVSGVNIAEGNIVELNKSSVMLTLTAPDGVDLYYRFTETTEALPAADAPFTKADNGSVTLTIDTNGILEYYTAKGEMTGEMCSLTFTGAETTGVNVIEAARADSEIYDLQGRKVRNVSKGIFIVNGCKVIR